MRGLPIRGQSKNALTAICGQLKSRRQCDRKKERQREPGEESVHLLITQLDIPIGDIEEMLPTIMRIGGDGNVDEWTPLGALRFSDERHASLVRKAVSLARVARDAGTDDVLPCRLAAAVAGTHVIKIQVGTVEDLAAILAGVFVPLEDIETREFHLFFRKPLEEAEAASVRIEETPASQMTLNDVMRGQKADESDLIDEVWADATAWAKAALQGVKG
jgi:hypothetical protein